MKLFDKLFKGKQVDKSINKEEIQQPIIHVKGEIPEERKNLFTGVWDAKRLLHELLEITESVKGWKIELYKTDSERTPYKIRCERVISAINAFNGRKEIGTDWGYILFEMLIPEGYSEMKMSELTSMIMDFLPKYETRIEDAFNQDREYTSRMQLFSFLFRYRFAIYKLATHWDNVLENINETLDKLLLLLLGDGFDKTFTEKELLEDYDYPNVTDEELHEMELEYC